jgi:acyl carrier protein
MSPDVNNSVCSAVETFIRTELLYGYSGEQEFDENTNLIESGLIDSISLVRLITFLEEHFQIRVQDEEIVPEHFRSLKQIETFVTEHRAGSTA